MNLFNIVLCAVGGGKSPAFDIGCGAPLKNYIQEHRDTQLHLDDFSDAALYQQLKKSDGNKAIVGK